VVTSAADQNANVIFGAVIDEGQGDEVRVTVIATGFGQQRRRRPRLAEEAQGPVPAPVRQSQPDQGGLDVPSFLRDGARSTDSRISRSARVCDDLVVPDTVLIVDDHPSFRATARAVLEADGFEIVGEAKDGREALELAATLHPKVVLL